MTKKANKIVFIILVLLSINKLRSQTLEKIVKNIAKVNMIQDETIGFTENKSENFINFELLKSKANNSQLIKLTEHSNATVNGYATFALIDKSYDGVPEIFTKFLNNDKVVLTRSGCTESEDKLSVMIYHYYWNTLKEEAREKDKLLLKLDSITLYNEKSDWLLVLRALENRFYPKNFNSQIELLAFEKTNYDAIFYLSNWYKAEYNTKIKSALLKYLENTNFENVGIDYYFKVIEELFKFRDEEINEKIILKLKNDKFWQTLPQKFKSLLQDNGIYEKLE